MGSSSTQFPDALSEEAMREALGTDETVQPCHWPADGRKSFSGQKIRENG